MAWPGPFTCVAMGGPALSLVKRPNSWMKSRQKSSDFPPCYCLEIYISSNSHNLLQFLLYNVNEKGGKHNRKPQPLPNGLKVVGNCLALGWRFCNWPLPITATRNDGRK